MWVTSTCWVSVCAEAGHDSSYRWLAAVTRCDTGYKENDRSCDHWMMAVRGEMSVCVCVCHALGAEPDHSFSFSVFQTTMTRHQTVSQWQQRAGQKSPEHCASPCVHRQYVGANLQLKLYTAWSKASKLLHRVLREEVHSLLMTQ